MIIRRIGRMLFRTTFLILFTFHFSPFTSFAQDDTKLREVYAQAESAYKVGRIDQTRDVLLPNLGTFQGNLRQNALHLLALTYLVEYDIPQTEQYVTQLLEQNPYYTPSSSDPATFVEIVNRIKAGMSPTITTASNQAESSDGMAMGGGGGGGKLSTKLKTEDAPKE